MSKSNKSRGMGHLLSRDLQKELSASLGMIDGAVVAVDSVEEEWVGPMPLTWCSMVCTARTILHMEVISLASGV